MTFEEALEYLKAGYRVKLTRWDDDQYVHIKDRVIQVEGIQKMTPRIDRFLQRAVEGPWEVVR